MGFVIYIIGVVESDSIFWNFVVTRIVCFIYLQRSIPVPLDRAQSNGSLIIENKERRQTAE